MLNDRIKFFKKTYHTFYKVACGSFCRFTGGSTAFHAVWGGQAEREAAFLNVKLHAARFRVCVGLTAYIGVLLDAGGKPLLQGGVVGADMDQRLFLVKPNVGGRFSLGKSCSHKRSFLRPRLERATFLSDFSRLLT